MHKTTETAKRVFMKFNIGEFNKKNDNLYTIVGFKKLKLNSVTSLRKQTTPTERPPLVGEVSANFCG
jgi:hypothetical protein